MSRYTLRCALKVLSGRNVWKAQGPGHMVRPYDPLPMGYHGLDTYTTSKSETGTGGRILNRTFPGHIRSSLT